MPAKNVVGGKLLEGNILFSQCSKYFFISSDSVILMNSVETGLVCKRLSGHTKKVVQMSLNPKNTLQVPTTLY